MDMIFPPAAVNFLKLRPLQVEYALQSFYQRVGTQVTRASARRVVCGSRVAERVPVCVAASGISGPRVSCQRYGATVRADLDTVRKRDPLRSGADSLTTHALVV